MAALATVKAGNWSDPTVWNLGRLPQDGDTVTVNHALTFDVDQSSFPNGLGRVDLYAPVTASQQPGNYYWKMAGAIYIQTGGQILAGTPDAAYPLECTFTIHFTVAGYYIMAQSKPDAVRLFCQKPSFTHAHLTADAGTNQNYVLVDPDLTGDIWRPGDKVTLCDINRGMEIEEYTVQQVLSDRIVFTSNIAVAKTASAIAVLSSRNIKLLGPNTTQSSYLIHSATAGTVLCCEFRNVYRAIYNSPNIDLNGALFTREISNACLYTTTYGEVKEAIFVGVAGNVGIASCNDILVEECLFAGVNTAITGVNRSLIRKSTFIGCGTAVNGLVHCVIEDCYFYGNGAVFSYSYDIVARRCTMQRNSYGVIGSAKADFYECTFGDPSPNLSNNVDIQTYGREVNLWDCQLKSPNKVAQYSHWPGRGVSLYLRDGGELKLYRWMRGGRVQPDAQVPNSHFLFSHLLTFENPAYSNFAPSSCFVDWPVVGIKGYPLRYRIWLKWNVATFEEPLRVELLDERDALKFLDTTAPLVTIQASGTAGQWNTIDLEYIPQYTAPLILRIIGKNASGNAWVCLEEKVAETSATHKVQVNKFESSVALSTPSVKVTVKE